MASIIIETGRVGWGRVKGVLSGLSLGWVRVTWCRGFLADRLREAADKVRGRL
jgi:hypothetical protein